MSDPAPADRRQIRRALISVYDKSRIGDVATALRAAGVEIVSTGSTAQALAATGATVIPVEQVTGFPECLDGRVKTLHPHIHAGLLADQRRPQHRQQLAELSIEGFDLVVSNLYPFAATVASGAGQDECIEQIDIGGPAMVRAAAKNHASVAVVTSPDQYEDLFEALRADGFSLAQRQRLAAAAFQHTARYDMAVASWMAAEFDRPADGFPGALLGAWEKQATLRYGENSHQAAALYSYPAGPSGIAQATQVHGKQMSYNNYIDADAAYRTAYDFAEPCVAIIKHANPCGIAVGVDIAEAHRLAHASDPTSAFGGVIATNRPVTAELATQVADVFTEVLVAPSFDEDALPLLVAKKNLRLLTCGGYIHRERQLVPISGGALLQQPDRIDAAGDDPTSWQLVAGPRADEQTMGDLVFAWRAVRAVKSNAILLARSGASVGIGMGQVSRVDSCRLAVERAGDRAAGSVAASDAFFPFPDGPQILIDAGVRAVVQPGGSLRDDDTIAAAQSAGVTMYLTGTRHFYH